MITIAIGGSYLPSASYAQVAIIANKSVPLNHIERSALLDFYTGDIRRWDDGKAIILFDLKPKLEIKEQFYKFLDKTPSRMKSIWLKNMLSGEHDPPEIVKSEEEMLKKVTATPGAVGYISAAKVADDVKILMLIATPSNSSSK